MKTSKVMALLPKSRRGFAVKETQIHLHGTRVCDEFCVGVGPVQMRITTTDKLVRVETTDDIYRCGTFPIGKVIDALNILFDEATGKEGDPDEH